MDNSLIGLPWDTQFDLFSRLPLCALILERDNLWLQIAYFLTYSKKNMKYEVKLMKKNVYNWIQTRNICISETWVSKAQKQYVGLGLSLKPLLSSVVIY